MVHTPKNFLIMVKNLSPMCLKNCLKRTSGDLIGNKIANKIKKVSKDSQQNNSEAVTNEHDKYIFHQKTERKLLMT